MSDNNNSPFSSLFTGLNFNFRKFFSRHDNYLNTAFILSITPLPFTAVNCDAYIFNRNLFSK